MMRADCLVKTPARPWSPNLQCDDKEVHNDSGISPGRSSSGAPSTSPHSPARPRGSPDSGGPYPQSPADSSVPFPRSPNDSNGPYPRSPAAPHSPYTASSPPEGPDGSLERLKFALERSSALSAIYKHEPEQKEGDLQQDTPRKEFPCPLCAYTTPYRHRYMEHVSTHYSDKCTLCDFKGQSSSELRAHLADTHGIIGGDLGDIADPTDQPDQPSDGQDDDDNSRRNKSKNFRCKQCSFVTTTKVDFWEHTKTHIKAEKLLTCPKCPFVTEYKHHLEYHLRNHFGSKPFKCNKCSYSCVNKSMLNSHLKSHSNVYQYRCADCSYATKYCHSLKLHLRKYDHAPAMVLNQDGSPNPLPIIDVYGTRRGPKQKPKPLESEEKNNLPGGIIVPAAPIHIPEETQPKLLCCSFCEFYTVSLEVLNQHMYMHAAESPFAHIMRTNNNIPDQSAIKDYFQNVFLNMEAPSSPLNLISPRLSPRHSPLSLQPASPLDLSKSEPEVKDEKRSSDSKKNRRKGKAYKLERAPDLVETNLTEVHDEISPKQEPILRARLSSGVLDLKQEIDIKKTALKTPHENGNDDDVVMRELNGGQLSPGNLNTAQNDDIKDENVNDSFKIKIPSLKAREKQNSEEPVSKMDTKENEGYSCDFCDMAFKDVVMYTMHMGYHGYRDPFTCNMCGQATPNRVAFFLHIARSSHT